MEVLLNTTVLFTLGLSLSMVIERVLEIVSALYNLVDSRYDFYLFWTARAEKIGLRLQRRLRVYEYVSPALAAGVLRVASNVLLGAQNGHEGKVPTISGDLVRAFWVKIFMNVLGIGLGILLAFQFHVDWLAIWKNMYVEMLAGDAPALAGTTLREPSVSGMLLTGLSIGLGAGPVHKIITSMENTWKRKKELMQRGRS